VIRSRAGALSRRAMIVVAAALIPILAGCEAGNDAPTLRFHQPTDGAGTEFGDISIRNVFVLGAPLGSSLAAGQSTGLFFALVNNNDHSDTLLRVSAPGTAASVSLPGGSVLLAPDQAALLTGPQPTAVLDGLTRTVTGGSFIPVTMTFQNAGTVTLSVPVMPRAQYFATFGTPAPTPTPTPTATVRHGRHHHRQRTTPAPSPSPGAPSPSPSPSP
jgi:copper(I)-binding protein